MSVAALKPQAAGTRVLSYAGALLETMDGGLAAHPNAFIMGQGVDDFKGIFGSVTDLAKKYGTQRVFDLPLMEEGMTGIAIGAALVGDYPITTHIRADFSFLAMNQILNLASKYHYMFGGIMSCPMLIRIVVGRSWGQGAQHSQSPQATFAHYPGLTVIMPATSQAIVDMYPQIINRHRGPVISIEHRLLYNLDFSVSDSGKPDPADQLRGARRPRRHRGRHLGHGGRSAARRPIRAGEGRHRGRDHRSQLDQPSRLGPGRRQRAQDRHAW